MAKRIQLNETQLKRIIKEAVEKVLEEPTDSDSEYGEFSDVMEFLTPFFDAWGWKYVTKLEDHKTANCLLIRFKHRLGASTCARLCAEINSHLEWSKFSNYKCLWGVNEKTRTFSFELWEKHYDNDGNRIK